MAIPKRWIVTTMTALMMSVASISAGPVAVAQQSQSGPAGSYKDTCDKIQVSGSKLTASCANDHSTNRVGVSSIADYTKCTGDIANWNGKLHCLLKECMDLAPSRRTCHKMTPEECYAVGNPTDCIAKSYRVDN